MLVYQRVFKGNTIQVMSKVDALIESHGKANFTSDQQRWPERNAASDWLLQSPTFWPMNHGKSVAHPLKLDVDSPPVVFRSFF